VIRVMKSELVAILLFFISLKALRDWGTLGTKYLG
jgi:hypothetical protein